jgi:hypothetical protein
MDRKTFGLLCGSSALTAASSHSSRPGRPPLTDFPADFGDTASSQGPSP